MPNARTTRLFICTALTALLATLLPPALLFAQSAPDGGSVGAAGGRGGALAGEGARGQSDKHPKLDSQLAATARSS